MVSRFPFKISYLLTGKHKPTYDNSFDNGDYVVVTNAKDVVFTGKKWKQKLYRWHTTYVGGLKEVPAWRWRENCPEKILTHAVNGMLPKNRLRRARLARLKVYEGEEHPHQAQESHKADIPLHVSVEERPKTIPPPDAPGWIVSISNLEDGVHIESQRIKDKKKTRKTKPPQMSYERLEWKYFKERDTPNEPSSEIKKPWKL